MAARLPLIAEVNHAVDALGMYRAELARILCLKCYDVSDSMQLELLLGEDPEITYRAKRFVYLYALLDKQLSGDTANMAHWIRRENVFLGTTPLLAMVDQGRLEDVIAIISKGV
ncbi:MAG TPA: hypothetical protein ENI67_07750 [Gammaproteobacteria bacterium]|nr:hypothetical protein [Gammaproteobacteria bacterium]